jgi:predicted RNA binding protein YcfA (HicA-like mRNA interferase family)
VPRLPRIGGRECVSALQRLGFSQVRQRGSHVIMRRGAQGCAVPMHRELKTGTLIGILRQAEVDLAEFVNALSR